MNLTVLASSTSTTAVNTVSNWWEDEQIRSWVVERPVKIAIILLIAVIAQWALRRIINQLAAKASKTPSGATIPRLPRGPKATKAERRRKAGSRPR